MDENGNMCQDIFHTQDMPRLEILKSFSIENYSEASKVLLHFIQNDGQLSFVS